MAVTGSGNEEITDNVDSDVSLVFNIMKDSLSKMCNKHKSIQQSKRTVLRKKIYDTFHSDNPLSPPSIGSNSPEERSEKKIVQNDFYIDRASKNEVCDNAKSSCESVETIDLSGLSQAITEEGHESNKTSDRKEKKKRDGLSSQLNSKVSTQDIYINVDPYKNPSGRRSLKKHELVHKEPEVMKKSVITDEYEKQDSIQTVHTSHRKKKKDRKLEREKTKGEKWYHMPAVELTEEQKNDLQILQMRKALDPKRFYKANDMSVQPKFVQFGRVIESAADFYDSRVPKKQRKSTIVEELLADTEFRKYNKRKYEEIQEARRMGKGPYTHMKRLKKHKK